MEDGPATKQVALYSRKPTALSQTYNLKEDQDLGFDPTKSRNTINIHTYRRMSKQQANKQRSSEQLPIFSLFIEQIP